MSLRKIILNYEKAYGHEVMYEFKLATHPLPPRTTQQEKKKPRHLSAGDIAGGYTRKSAPAKQRICIWRPDLSHVATCTRGHNDNMTIPYTHTHTHTHTY